MKRLLAIVIFILLSAFGANAQEMEHHDTSFQGLKREYYLYVPDSMDVHRPLVVLLHGYGGKAEGYFPEFAKCAKRNGFALCIPKGWPAPNTDKNGWNVRYPSQEGMETDDIAFVMYLTDKLQKEYNLSSKATFLSGMSNGGEMCYCFAWLHPEFFRAIASISGLTMKWLPDQNPLPQVSVPFMEIHGTLDMTSHWEGDPNGDYGWGPYISVSSAISYLRAFDRCSFETQENLQLLSPESNQVILHRYQGGRDGCEVRLYEVVGGKHSLHLKDMDTPEIIWSFFREYLD